MGEPQVPTLGAHCLQGSLRCSLPAGEPPVLSLWGNLRCSQSVGELQGLTICGKEPVMGTNCYVSMPPAPAQRLCVPLVKHVKHAVSCKTKDGGSGSMRGESMPMTALNRGC